MPCLTARLDPKWRERVKCALPRLGYPNCKNMALAIRATEIADPQEYQRLKLLQGDPRWNDWSIAGGGLSPNPTVSRWRIGHNVRLEAHFVLCLVVLEITGWNTTPEEMTDGSLDQLIAHRSDIVSQLRSFRSRSQFGLYVSR